MVNLAMCILQKKFQQQMTLVAVLKVKYIGVGTEIASKLLHRPGRHYGGSEPSSSNEHEKKTSDLGYTFKVKLAVSTKLMKFGSSIHPKVTLIPNKFRCSYFIVEITEAKRREDTCPWQNGMAESQWKNVKI